MVMRRVLKHHVCLCVLSTAIVAGLALITSQKVYAQVQETKNCMGLVQDSQGLLSRHHDEAKGKIVCNSSSGTRVLEGERTIDMSDPDEGEEAVKITGSEANITIGDNLLTVTDSKSSDKSAIRVEEGARLTLKENVSITDVQKVMEVEGSGSVITVNGGTFGLKNAIEAGKDGGRVMIEVKKGGKVVFDKRGQSNGGDLTISGGEGAMTTVTGIEVSGTGGEVEMRKGTTVNFERVTEAIKIKGSAEATVSGGGTINVTGSGGGSTVVKMEGSGKADVMSLTINGSGTVTGAEVSSGTLELTKVTLKNVTTGAKVTGSGTLKVLEGTITGKGTGTGVYAGGEKVTLNTVEISQVMTGVEAIKGQLVINGTSTITVTDGGTGLNITGGSATMMGGSITGTGGARSRSTGVYAGTSETVTLNTVEISQFMAGVEATKGQLVINGTSTITVEGMYAYGVKVSGSATADLTRVGITVTGMYGTGLNITGGSATMTGGSITGSGEAESTGTGVKMDSSGTVTLNTVNVSGVQTGVEATNGKLVITGGSIEGKTWGVKVTGGNATMTGTTITGENGTGLNITGGSATMTGGSITGKDGNQGTGVMVGTSQTVTLTSVGISQVMTGVEAINGQLVINGTSTITVTDGGTGVKVSGSATADLTRVKITVTGMYGTGVWMEGSGTAKLTGVTVTGGSRGVWVQGNGRLEMTEGSIEFTGAHGVYVRDNATAKLTEVKITGSGTGVEMRSSGTMTLTSVNISQVQTGVNAAAGQLVMNMGTITVTNGGTGVKVSGTATSAELKGTQIKGNGGGTGITAAGTGNVTMTNVDISKVQLGVEVKKGTGTMTITGGSIKEVKWGINMEGGKKLVMDGGTTISFTDGYGVKIQNNVTAELMGTVITGNGGGTGVTAEGTGNVTMNMVEISKVQMGVNATGGTVTITGGWIREVQTGIDMIGTGTLTVSGTEIQFKENGYGVGVWGDVTVSLTGTKIMGGGSNGATGIGVIMAGKMMTMEDVRISRVAMGVYAGSGTLEIKEGTISFAKTYGVKVGGSVTSTELTRVTIVGEGKGTGVYAGTAKKVTLNMVEVSVQLAFS
ncbi:right-handed parallel beta-helix repeat-containing protein [Bartonella sp. WD16.2]|uniref:right-handed parallel beta-helix repeat-containing protein n=1 Tax=Bartonella sp. WD16.2 TaxID=1933904 RepID=UPI00099AD6D4|nr:right-handed parallel beta-helix repeat-containing protein [Bartonella sp. WD16.2]AQX20169.1 Right handed beta helix region [Bartonella sp. WD16.2]